MGARQFCHDIFQVHGAPGMPHGGGLLSVLSVRWVGVFRFFHGVSDRLKYPFVGFVSTVGRRFQKTRSLKNRIANASPVGTFFPIKWTILFVILEAVLPPVLKKSGTGAGQNGEPRKKHLTEIPLGA